MIRLLIVTALIGALAFLANQMAHTAQALSLELYGYSVQISTTFALLITLTFALLFFALGQLVSFIKNTPKRLHAWHAVRKEKEGVDLFIRALQSLKTQDTETSKTLADKVAKLTSDKRLPLYLQAEIHQQNGALEAAETTYKQLEKDASTALMAQVSLLNVYKSQNAYEALKLTAQQVLKQTPQNLTALNALWDALLHLEQYDEALKLAPKLRRLGVKGADELDILCASIYLQQALRIQAEDNKQAEKLLKKALTARSTFTPAVLKLADILQKDEKTVQAEKQLHTFLLSHFDDTVFDAWLTIVEARAPKSWAKVFAKLEDTYTEGTYAGVVCRSICLEKQGNRTKAQAILIKFCDIQPSRKLYLWCARLEDAIAGKIGAGHSFMEQALSLSADKTTQNTPINDNQVYEETFLKLYVHNGRNGTLPAPSKQEVA